MRKSRKRNAIVLALIVLLIATAIGYAAFASSLEISGNARAYGEWDVHFANASITKNDANNSVTIMDNGQASLTGTGDSLDVAVQLDYPGDSVTVTVDVENDGTCAANLTGFTIDPVEDDDSGAVITPANNVWTDGALQMQLNQANYTANSTSIASQGSSTYTMVFTWDPTVNTSTDVTAIFTITMNFQQPTV